MHRMCIRLYHAFDHLCGTIDQFRVFPADRIEYRWCLCLAQDIVFFCHICKNSSTECTPWEILDLNVSFRQPAPVIEQGSSRSEPWRAPVSLRYCTKIAHEVRIWWRI